VRSSEGIRTCCTDLYAYQVWESERHIQLILKVLRHRRSFAISDLECSVSGTLTGQFLDKTSSVWVLCTMGCSDLDSRNELLKPQSLIVGKSVSRCEGIWSPRLTKELERQVDQFPWPIHCTSRNVHIGQHATNSGTQGLKVSAPQEYSRADGSFSQVGRKRKLVRWVSEVGCYVNNVI
jgi:hypothetical protein